MKFLRYLFAFALVAGLSGVAKADDFQMVIIDPPQVPAKDVNFITSLNFSFSLQACDSGQLNGLDPKLYLGCFTGLNDTGQVLTSLQIIIPAFDAPTGGLDVAGCGLAGNNLDIFKNTPTCGFTNSSKTDYFVDFTGGNLPTALVPSGDCDGDNDGHGHGFNKDDVACNQPYIFTIAVGFGANCGKAAACEQLKDDIVNDFSTGVTASANVTPEPNSFLLMSTGILSIGLFGAYRRRQMSPLMRRL